MKYRVYFEDSNVYVKEFEADSEEGAVDQAHAWLLGVYDITQLELDSGEFCVLDHATEPVEED